MIERIRISDQDTEPGLHCHGCGRYYGELHTAECPQRALALRPATIARIPWTDYTCPDCSNPRETCFCGQRESLPSGVRE